MQAMPMVMEGVTYYATCHACAAPNVRRIPHQQLAKEEATMAVKPIPKGYHCVTPYLVVQDVPPLLDFLKQAFDATEIFRLPRPDGTIMPAEVRIGMTSSG
jgi:hypothetical protein